MPVKMQRGVAVVRRQKPSDRQRQPAVPVSDAQQPVEKAKPATGFEPSEKTKDCIRRLGRKYSLSLGSLGSIRAMSEDKKEDMIRGAGIQADKDNIRPKQVVYPDGTPFVPDLRKSALQLRFEFEKLTLAAAADGYRIFMLDDSEIDYANMSVDDIDKVFARQVSAFTDTMHRHIADYKKVVDKVQSNWAQIIAFCRSSLKDCFNEAHYPSSSQVGAKLYVHFTPHGVLEDLPSEYRFISKSEQARIRAIHDEQIRLVAQKQAAHIVEWLTTELSSTIESLQNYQSGQKKTFHRTRTDAFFKVLDEFREKTLRYGILGGTEFEAIFKRLDSVLHEGGVDAESLPKVLRSSKARLADMTGKLQIIAADLLETRRRRQLIID